mmetsp:Transcript_26596/g.85268  ORF Transcript_26596/g.85268 Transcript_26596/m.85268 type:complete len:84 (+) Transcript_26596:574-825(+)
MSHLPPVSSVRRTSWWWTAGLHRDFTGIPAISSHKMSLLPPEPRKPDRPPDDLTVATLQAADEIISFADTFASPKKLTKNDEL